LNIKSYLFHLSM